jgi:hypothetical protein
MYPNMDDPWSILGWLTIISLAFPALAGLCASLIEFIKYFWKVFHERDH